MEAKAILENEAQDAEISALFEDARDRLDKVTSKLDTEEGNCCRTGS